MSLGILNQDGAILLHHKMKTAPEPFVQAMAPDREDRVGGGEGLVTWYWLAARWAQEGIPCVLGHALSMNAIPGGPAKHDKIDAHKLAVRLRGGMLPQASVYPAKMRATRDRQRRRLHRMRQRAELLAHVQTTTSQYHLPDIGKTRAYQGHREGVAERVADPAVHKSLAVDVGLITAYDQLLTDLALALVKSAKPHAATPFYRLRSIPGVGKILALGLRYEIPDIHRFPRVQDVVSDCR